MSLAYDGLGNLKTDNGWTYTYDDQNRLISAESGGTALAYDPLGRCVKRTDTGTTTYFVWDADWNRLADYSSSGTLVYRYLDGASTDELLSRTDGSEMSFTTIMTGSAP